MEYKLVQHRGTGNIYKLPVDDFTVYEHNTVIWDSKRETIVHIYGRNTIEAMERAEKEREEKKLINRIKRFLGV